ncbi:hypothetical protein jhhlp_002099 [Lomentospora prolificans]|uniref:Hsp90 chaperone protein kinase-targeting subunit n=1 Tax=Lomentospora prolificans TaxID=41688 RepID=A0A2N3ND47_9PEZI|nr:hypothetical protein jhhlp_002099 [Lomentospora prolificans]
MPVDYSKWDALELSDDSDIEVHPNVDKRSFIRAKQNQIHMEREQRKHHITTLKFERSVNDGLIKRISDLLTALKSHASDPPASSSTSPVQHAAQVAFKAVMESAPKNPEDDQPPPRPEGVHPGSEPPPTYSKMMMSVLDQVNKALEEKKVEPEKRYEAMVEEVGVHLERVQNLQKELQQKMDELEGEEKKKITSESYHTGFDSSYVNKSASKPDAKPKEKHAQPELLNPDYEKTLTAQSDPTAAGGVNNRDENEEVEASPTAKEFSRIPISDYRRSFDFITAHPEILAEKESDGLLVEAFDASLEGNEQYARQCVHQALLLQYCRALGKDGVPLFFKRISQKSNAHEMFFKDVQDTYAKIRTRTREIAAERAAEGASGGVEQIQLHAVEPGTTINITIPDANSDDEEVKKARAIFEDFKPELKKALESGSLDEVNKVLGEMKVEEAEEVVGLLGDAGCLSLEEKIIDTTTEEGRKQLEEMGRSGDGAAGASTSAPEELHPDPE